MVNDIRIILVGFQAIKTNHSKIKSVNSKFEDTIKIHSVHFSFLYVSILNIASGRSFYLFPFNWLCIRQSIWQLDLSVVPPLLHAETWSASISS